MRYLLRVNHANEYADHHLYAVLEVGDDLARRVLERRRRVLSLTSADSNLCEVAYQDYSVEWYDWIELDDLVRRGWLTLEERAAFDDEGICVLSDDAELGDESTDSTTCSRMVIHNCGGVSWTSRSKHYSDEFSTPALAFELFEPTANVASSDSIVTVSH
jgi:hypothetical protein